MTLTDKLFTTWLIIGILALIGWGMNIAKLIHSAIDGPVDDMLILRAVGALLAPLGAVLGYV